MIKFMIGVGFTALLLLGLVIIPNFIYYSNMSNFMFGINNTLFLCGGFILGMLFYREFFTDETPEIDPTDLPPLPYDKAEKVFRPKPLFDNDSLGGNNAN